MDHPVRHSGKMFIMGYDDKGLAKFLTQVKKETVKFLLIMGIQISRWFISKDNGRIVNQRPRNSNSLFFATRKLRRFMIEPIGQFKELEQFSCTDFHLFPVSSGNVSRNADILEGGEFREEVVKLKDKTNFPIPEPG